MQRRNKDMEACLRCERDFKEMAMAEARLLSDENALLRRQGAPQEPASEPMPPVDWRRCPDCGDDWPHPSVTEEVLCPSCWFAAERNHLERQAASLRRLANAVRGLGAGLYQVLRDNPGLVAWLMESEPEGEPK